MLHTLSHSPFESDLTTLCRTISAGDELILIQDGVIAGIDGSALELLLSAPITVFVLSEDIEARGLSAQISNRITTVSYTDFVRLAVKHSTQMAW